MNKLDSAVVGRRVCMSEIGVLVSELANCYVFVSLFLLLWCLCLSFSYSSSYFSSYTYFCACTA